MESPSTICSWFSKGAKEPRLEVAPWGKGGDHCGWRLCREGPHPLRIPCSARAGAAAGLGRTVEDRGVLGGGQGHSCLQPVSPGWTPLNAAQLESSLSEGVAHVLPQLVLKPGEPRKPGSNSDHRLSLGKSVTLLESSFPPFDF